MADWILFVRVLFYFFSLVGNVSSASPAAPAIENTVIVVTTADQGRDGGALTPLKQALIKDNGGDDDDDDNNNNNIFC